MKSFYGFGSAVTSVPSGDKEWFDMRCVSLRPVVEFDCTHPGLYED